MNESIVVEVVYALPDRQWSRTLSLTDGATLADALTLIANEEGFAALDLANVAVGIWGKEIADRAHALRDGDRVEIYRPLLIDPKVARRQRGLDSKNRP